MFARIALAAAALWPGLAFGQTCAPRVMPAVFHWSAASLDGAFEGAGHRFRVDPDLGRAITWVESAYNAWAVSSKGAQGLMQLMPGTSAGLGVSDPFNPHQSIYGGMEYVRQLANDPRFAGDPYMVLVAYNAGPNHTVFPQISYQYADQVIAVYWRLKAEHMHGGFLPPNPIDYLRVPQCGGRSMAHTTTVAVHRIVFASDGKVAPTRHYP